MRATAFVIVSLALTAGVAEAQERRTIRGIPQGHMPPPGECRVWYEGRPPGQQPPPTDCRTAEEIARRDRYARVIYGDDRYRDREGGYVYDERGRVYGDRGRVYDERDRRESGRRDRDSSRDENRGRTTTGRAVPRGGTYPGDYSGVEPYGRDTRYGYGGLAWDNGYRDGVEKGREDVRKNRRYEPNRHQWYKSGTRGYDRSSGSKDAYIDAYREAFTRGYAEGFRARSSRPRRGARTRVGVGSIRTDACRLRRDPGLPPGATHATGRAVRAG